jgi:TolA-binding protein
MASPIAPWSGKGDYQQAAALLEPFKAQYQDSDRAPAALVLLGRADLELNQVAPATEVYQLVLTRYPDNAAAAEAQVGLARIYRQQKSYDKALDALAKALKTATGAVGAEAQYELGCTYRDRGETKRAAEELLKVAILYADERFGARAQFEAGQCYEKLGDTASALKTYKVVLRDYPKQQQVLDLAQARVTALDH